MGFNNLPIQVKIVGLLGALGVISVGAAGFAATRMLDIDARYQAVVKGPDVAQVYLARANRQMAWSERAIYKAMASTTPEDLATAKDNLFQARKKVPEYTAAAKAAVPAQGERIDTLARTFDSALDGACRETIDLAHAGDDAGAFAAMKADCGPALNGAIEQAKVLLETNIAASETAAKAAHSDTLSTIAVTLALILAGLGAVMALAIVLTRNGIVRPLDRLNTAMSEMDRGSLDQAVPGQARKDELGAMARTLEAFREGLAEAARLRVASESAKSADLERARRERETVDAFQRRMVTLAQTFVKSADEVSAAAQSLAGTAEETARQAEVVTGAARDAAANVGTAAAATEEMTASIREIGSQVHTASGITHQAADAAALTQADIQRLSDAANRIGEVVSLINDIAAQTNLLALNATIEAARAGEAGKGFAVVASEVKQLATQTARATGDIGQKVAEIQSATNRAVTSIGTIVGTVGDVRTIATAIAAAVEQQGAATEEIAGNTQRAADGTTQVTETITGVSRAAEMTGAASAQLMALSGQLSDQAQVLHEEVDGFVRKMA